MYICSMHYNELFKGTLSTVILKLLAEHGKMYGYEITKMVAELTDGEISIKEGSLYPALHKLEKEEAIIAHFEYIGKRKRKYYSLTKKGQELAGAKLEEFQKFTAAINKILTPNIHLA